MRNSLPRTTRIAALAVALALGAAGCGGDDGSAPADAAATLGTDAADESPDTPTDGGTDEDPGDGGDDATAATGGGAELPEAWPMQAMPVSTEGTVVSASEEAGHLQAVGDIPQSLEDQVMYYEIVFDQSDWTVESESIDGDGATWEVSGNGYGTSRVVLEGQGDSTRVTIDLYPEDGS